jgi:hypothetical protein
MVKSHNSVQMASQKYVHSDSEDDSKINLIHPLDLCMNDDYTQYLQLIQQYYITYQQVFSLHGM